MAEAAISIPREQTAFDRIADRSFRVGIIGLGYVGLPLARTFARNGFACVGFDIDPSKVEKLNSGVSYIRHLDPAVFSEFIEDGRFTPTTDFSQIDTVNACIICVPTPLNRYREPDLSYVVQTCETIAKHLRPGQLVVLESTTYPGTITDVVQPILERGGLKAGSDFYLAFSPEREDPGNESFETATIPKVVGADDAESLALATALYKEVVSRVVPVSTAATAEAVKITENIFRAVNIALVNELKVIYAAMNIDVWEVIDAAKTKPFGFMAFYPGPGLGGHCIPIDPFYLTWKAREYGLHTRFIELAGEINTAMPSVVVQRLAEALDQRSRIGLNGAKILVLGIAYKKNVDDMRESPALKLIELLKTRGAEVTFHDPFVPEIPPTREHPEFTGMRSVDLNDKVLQDADAVLIATDHDRVDYDLVVRHARLVVDTRNATRSVQDRSKIVKS
jgi:UDP-N-acetyl-D-glucosamine dehydrogenase